jgi:hypothetical protein
MKFVVFDVVLSVLAVSVIMLMTSIIMQTL